MLGFHDEVEGGEPPVGGLIRQHDGFARAGGNAGIDDIGQQALGMEIAGSVAFTDESATIQNLLRTNQPATVYRDRPEEWFTDANANEKALLLQINAELLRREEQLGGD